MKDGFGTCSSSLSCLTKFRLHIYKLILDITNWLHSSCAQTLLLVERKCVVIVHCSRTGGVGNRSGSTLAKFGVLPAGVAYGA